MTDITRSEEPHDRLTSLCARMTKPLEEEENVDVKAIVFLQDGSKGGIQISGYEDEVAGMAALFTHMQAIFRALGKDLDFIAVPNSPGDLDAPEH